MTSREMNSGQEFLKEQLPYIRKICAGFTDDRDELNDLVQEVSIQLWQSLRSFRGQAKITTWIYRITVNMCLYHLGKKKKRKQIRLDGKEMERELGGGEQETNEEFKSDLLFQAIKVLNPVNRAIIMLYLDRHKHEEIAEIVGLSANNVGVRINRTKKELKKYIDARYSGTMG